MSEIFVADRDVIPLGLKHRSSPLASVNKRRDMMTNDFSKIHLTNALASTSGHQRNRKPLLIAVLLLLSALGVAVYLL